MDASALCPATNLTVPQQWARYSGLVRSWWRQTLFPSRPTRPVVNQRAALGGLAFLALLSGLQLFAHLDHTLFEPDEGRYAEIGRGMLQRGDPVVPMLHNQPYLDKPPLFYWLIAGSFSLFGPHEWAARLVPAGAAWLSILGTYLFALHWLGVRPAFLAGLLLTLSMGFIYCGRFLIIDSVLGLLVAWALFAALSSVAGPRLKWGWWLASAVCCGLGVLTKGPVAWALILPPVAAFVWLAEGVARPRRSQWGMYFVVSLLVPAPWYIAMLWRVPGFARYFFWEHNISRFVGGMNHAHGFWFYLPVLLLWCVPWTLALGPYWLFQFSRSARIATLRPPISGFFLIWAVWVLAFFSLSSCKLPPYILPAFPALAILLGIFAEEVLFGRTATRWLELARGFLPWFTLGSLCVATVAVIWVARHLHFITFLTALIETALCAGIWLANAVYGRRWPTVASWGLCGGLAFAITWTVARDLVPGLAYARNSALQSPQLARFWSDPQVPIIAMCREWGSLPFYLHREDIFCFDGPPTRQLTRDLAGKPRTLIVYRHDYELEQLQEAVPRGMQLRQLHSEGRTRVVIIEPAQTARRR